MKRIALAITCFLVVFTTAYSSPKVKTGIEVLRESNFKILQGKRVGLITNPTGVDSQLKSTVDILNEAPGVKLVALYGPEHGVRGDIHAGDHVETVTDAQTGLPVYSLYGKTRKATPEMLKDIDVLVYDIQDIGCRSYTYISTMGLAMEAAAENNIEFVVLDRPNAVGGLKIEGNLAEDKFISFVSQFKIPYLYGLTCGELAKMLNNEKMLGAQCKLTVVPMKGWKRSMTFDQTGLPWVLTSPHIPHATSPYFYAASGILGEFSFMSIGVGYTLPFQVFAKDSIDALALANRLNKLQLPGVIFRPIFMKPFYAVGQGKNYSGVQFYFTDYKKVRITEIQFYVMQEMAALYPEKKVFGPETESRYNMFDKVCGSDQIRLLMAKNMRVDDMLPYWRKDEEAFRKLAKKYWMYK
ncbi:MAG: exo-beta-N-acetylmuramidase NamZ domain-containing protein [Draconibacterium sp.]